MNLAPGDSPRVIANARLTGADRLDPFGSDPVDLHLSGGRIIDIAPAGALARTGGVFDAEGAWVIPGLWDHHVHTVQWALVAQRTDVSFARTAQHAIALMADAPVLPDGRKVGSGFRDALWPDLPVLADLDAATGEVPTYLINADVHSVWLNSAALRREGFSPSLDGMLREEPAFEISRRLNAADPAVSDLLVATALQRAAARGVVGIVDFDMAWNPEAWVRRMATAIPSTRVSFGVYPPHLGEAIAEGLQTGDALDPAGLVRMGPLKVITDGSLGTRTAACSHPYPDGADNLGHLAVGPEALAELLTRATGSGIASAVHAIGDVAVSHALDAFGATGAWGTIEHAQLVAHADIPRFARLGVGASVQPVHTLDDRVLTDTFWAGQTALPYPLRALSDTGANLLFGSDAPVAALDPWAAMAAAIYRTRGDDAPWHPEEAVAAHVALAASTAGGSATGSSLEPGGLADLAIVSRDPLVASEAELRDTAVSATLIAGRLTHVS